MAFDLLEAHGTNLEFLDSDTLCFCFKYWVLNTSQLKFLVADVVYMTYSVANVADLEVLEAQGTNLEFLAAKASHTKYWVRQCLLVLLNV